MEIKIKKEGLMKDFIITFLVSILTLVTPIKPLIFTVGFVIAIDFLFGVYRAWRLDPNSITSRKMGHTVSKILLYNLAVITVYFVAGIWSQEFGLLAAKATSLLIALTEVKSIDESFQILFGFGFYSKLISFLKRDINDTKGMLQDAEPDDQSDSKDSKDSDK